MSALKVGEFGDLGYWDRRYREEAQHAPGGFEWYPGAEALVLAALERWAARGGAVLELGCGSSRLAQAAAAAGWGPVLATDLSQVVVDQCRARAGAEEGVEYRVMDACCLACADAEFDAVLDKGTLDALDCAGRTAAAVGEAARVLRAGGLYCLVSCRDPPSRLPALRHAFALLETIEIWGEEGGRAPCPNAYLYCLRKQPAT